MSENAEILTLQAFQLGREYERLLQQKKGCKELTLLSIQLQEVLKEAGVGDCREQL